MPISVGLMCTSTAFYVTLRGLFALFYGEAQLRGVVVLYAMRIRANACSQKCEPCCFCGDLTRTLLRSVAPLPPPDLAFYVFSFTQRRWWKHDCRRSDDAEVSNFARKARCIYLSLSLSLDLSSRKHCGGYLRGAPLESSRSTSRNARRACLSLQ